MHERHNKECGLCAFYRTGLRRIVIPAIVEVIGKKSFFEYSSLCEVVFERESELKEIGEYAFSGCSIDSLEIPSKCEILNGVSLRV
jgi:hypothetical protein